MRSQVRCSLFQKLTSKSGGTVSNVDSSDIAFLNCRFINVTSSAAPGCFRINNGSICIKRCYFRECSATGGNACYGRISHVTYSTLSIVHFSAIRCGTVASNVGDSVNVIYNNNNVIIENYNTSYCYGTDGSSFISLKYNVQISSLKNINNADNIDWNTCEFYYNEQESTVEKGNFINSSKNTHYCLQIDEKATFNNCCFFNTFSTFCLNANYLTFNNCISDKEQSGLTFITITSKPNFVIIIKEIRLCNTLKLRRSSASNNFILFLILIS